MNAWIWGVGSTRFGRQPDKLPAQLGWEAVEEALEDAQVDAGRIDAAYVGTVFGTLGIAQRTLAGVGLAGIPIVTVENACASGSTALQEAAHAIDAGRYEHVLALGVEHLTSRFSGPIASDPTDIDQATGLLFPGLYAMSASRYLFEHDATRRGPRRGRGQEHAPRLDEPSRAASDGADARTGAWLAHDRRAAHAVPVHRAVGRGRSSGARAAAAVSPRRRDPGDGARVRTRLGSGLARHLGRRARARHRREGVRARGHRAGRRRRARGPRRVHDRRDRHARGDGAGAGGRGARRDRRRALQRRRRHAREPLRRAARPRAPARRDRARAGRRARLAVPRRSRARARPRTRGSRCSRRWAAASAGSTATRASSPCSSADDRARRGVLGSPSTTSPVGLGRSGVSIRIPDSVRPQRRQEEGRA